MILFFCCANWLAAQTVEWGNQQKFKSKTNYAQVIGENSTGVFLLRAKSADFKGEVVIEKYKSNLLLESAKEQPLPNSTKAERVFITERGVTHIQSQKSNGNTELVATMYDNNLNITQNIQLVSVDAAQNETKFLFRSSTDKNMFAVIYLTKADKQKTILNICGFDGTLTPKYTRKFPIAEELEKVFVTNMECDNMGNVFALIDLPKENEKRARSFFVYGYFPSTDGMFEYAINKDSTYINEIALVANNHSKTVAVAGFYSNKPDNKCLGHFYYNIDIISGKITAQAFTPFDISFVSKTLSSISADDPIALTDLFVRKLIPNSNGGVTIIAEKYYESKQSYTYSVNGFPQTNYRNVYNFDEIVIIATDGDGKTRFKQAIKKKQSSISDGGYYSSFFTVLGNDKMGIIYNTDVSQESDVMMATISNKGEIDSKVLIKSVSYYATVMPLESRQVSSNAAIITTLKDRRFCLMRLTF